MSKFWNMAKAKNDDTVGELMLYGDISSETWWGDEVTPKQFKSDLDALGDIGTLNIYINSGGGDVFAGISIFNMLKRHSANKVVYIDGLAASIASIIAMAGDKVIMPANSMMMIHNAWTFASGNKNDLRNMADELERVDGILRDTYVAKSGMDADEVSALMDAETWMTASDAVEKGLADEIEESKAIAACLTEDERKRYNVPNNYAAIDGGESVPCNGETSQPVEENNTPETGNAVLAEQDKDFNRIRRKLYERI